MRNPFALLVGSVLILLGVVFLLDNLGVLNADWVFDNFWPIVFILIGIAFLIRRPSWQLHASSGGSWNGREGSPQEADGTDYFTASEVFGDFRRQVTSKRFAGGDCSVVFGAIDLDLTGMEPLPGDQALRIATVFGGVRLVLPSGSEYSVRCNHVAGGVTIKGERRGGVFQNVSYQTSGFAVAERRLSIQISSVFGDVSINESTQPLS